MQRVSVRAGVPILNVNASSQEQKHTRRSICPMKTNAITANSDH